MHERQAAFFSEQLPHQMVRAAQPCRAPVHAFFLGFGPGRKFLEVVGRHRIGCHQKHGETHQQTDRRKILFGVVVQLAKQRRVGRQGRKIGREHDVADVARAGHVFGRDVGASTRLVGDDDRTAQGLGHGIGQQTRHHIRATACRITNHPFQRLTLGLNSQT